MACSGSGSAPAPNSPSATPTPTPSESRTVTITATGVTPTEVSIVVGGRVLFVNSDSRGHELWGGIDHDNRSCPEVDVAGFLVPGQIRETGPFQTPGTCHFHDHANYGNPSFAGRIIVRAAE